MLRKLAAYRRQNQLDLALQELGRIERTLFMLETLPCRAQQERAASFPRAGHLHLQTRPDGRQRERLHGGSGRPPLHTRFKKGRSGNPGGRSAKSLPALLADVLDETVVVTIDSRRHKIAKREAIVAQIGDY